MRKKRGEHPIASALKTLVEQGSKVPDDVRTTLPGQIRPEGESIFQTAMKSATADQIARAQQHTGNIDSDFYLSIYKRNKEPMWLWLTLSDLKSPGDIPEETFQYLKVTAKALFAEVLLQLQALDIVRIQPGLDTREGITRRRPQGRPSQQVSQILGFSTAGTNPFQAVAREFQAISMRAAVAEMVDRSGCFQEDAYAALAIATGRVSSEAAVSVEKIRKICKRGKALLSTKTVVKRQCRTGGGTDG